MSRSGVNTPLLYDFTPIFSLNISKNTQKKVRGIIIFPKLNLENLYQ